MWCVDLDGVLRHWPDRSPSIESLHGLPEGAIGQAAFEPSLVARAITGSIPDPQWRSLAARSLQERYPMSSAAAAVELWSAEVGTVDEQVHQTLRAVNGQARLVLCTNATSRLAADLDALGLSRLFAAVVNSSDIGVAKPESGYFRRALAIASATPEQVVFIDDSLANVRAALNLGIRSLHFCGPASLRSFLSECELLGHAT